MTFELPIEYQVNVVPADGLAVKVWLRVFPLQMERVVGLVNTGN